MPPTVSITANRPSKSRKMGIASKAPPPKRAASQTTNFSSLIFMAGAPAADNDYIVITCLSTHGGSIFPGACFPGLYRQLVLVVRWGRSKTNVMGFDHALQTCRTDFGRVLPSGLRADGLAPFHPGSNLDLARPRPYH